jgi:hypothetical protein
MWSNYMGHVVTLIGGVHVDFKTADQSGPVYRPVSKARQEAALEFIAENVFETPTWLLPEDVLSRIGPPVGGAALTTRQANIVGQLLDPRRLGRLADSELLAANPYPLAEYMSDVRRAVWGSPGANPDANRRTLHRVYLERLDALISPPTPPAGAQGGLGGGGGGGGPQQPIPLLTMPNVPRTDLPALARAQVRAIREDARRAATSASSAVLRAHWQDIGDRADRILDPRER